MPDEAEPECELSFEQALSQLERIVAGLERGEPELTSALAKYEKGAVLLTHCHHLLEQAEQSIALLTGVDEEGNPLTAPFDATATIAREAGSVSASNEPLTGQPKERKTPDRPSSPKNRAPSQDLTDVEGGPPF